MYLCQLQLHFTLAVLVHSFLLSALTTPHVDALKDNILFNQTSYGKEFQCSHGKQ